MKKVLLTKLFFFLLIGGMFAQAGQIDRTFNTKIGAGFDKTVATQVLQPDGKILVAGSFISYDYTSKNRITRLLADGTLDTTFNTGTGPNADIISMALQTDGKILIIGVFTAYNGIAINKIARLNSDGSLDTTFSSGTGSLNAYVSLAIQTDGKILIGGFFSTYNDIAVKNIARLNADGSLDTSFNSGTGPNSTVSFIVPKPDGKILIAGDFTTYNETSRNRIAQLNADGTLDTSFNPEYGANSSISCISIQPDGKILIGGSFSTYNFVSRKRIARINTDGTIDSSFNPGVGIDNSVYSMNIQADGKILIGGQFTQHNTISRNNITRVNSDGTIDSSFNPGTGTNQRVSTITTKPDGKILISGNFTAYNATPLGRIAQLNGDGTLDTSFFIANGIGVGSNGSIESIALQSDGKIIVAGGFTAYNGTPKIAMFRLNTDGTLDVPFIPLTTPPSNGGAVEYCVVVQPDDKILLAGRHYNSSGTVITARLARFTKEGNIDPSFTYGAAGSNGEVYTITLQPDGKILIGGEFIKYNNMPLNHLTRLNLDGTFDTEFNIGTGANGNVNAIAVQHNGKIIITGDFTTYNGVSVNRIARLNTNGTLDTTFNLGTGADKSLKCVKIQPDGKILIGGYFTSFSGIAKNRIVRLNTDGTLDATFINGTGANSDVLSIETQSDGKILIGGYFTSYNGIVINRIARLNADGTLDASFDVGNGASYLVNDILIQPDGKILVAGVFNSFNNFAVGYITRLQSGNDSLVTEDFYKETLKIYPNPATDTVYFSQELTEIAVYNMQGKKINVPHTSNSVDVSALSKGIYILNALKNNGKIITQIIIKQ